MASQDPAKIMVDEPFRIEPVRLAAIGEDLTDAIAALSASAATLGRALHPSTAAGLARLVSVMNCYYSNLIEGHNTRPRDIMAALRNEPAPEDAAQRNLVLEALAHIRVQEQIDQLAAEGALPEPASPDFIKWVHREFYRDLPRDMLRIKGRDREFDMIPGDFRSEQAHDVEIGDHLPPASGTVDAFMRRFAEAYRLEGVRLGTGIMLMAAAHHRLAFIHPFPDGNGRVGRLISHAMAHKIGIGAHGLWSISRGLARGLVPGLEGRGEYKAALARADMRRQGDLDGRGNLSERALADWTLWFVRVCVDQVDFMSGLFDINALADRLTRYVRLNDRDLHPAAAGILVEALIRGEVERGDASRIAGMPERSARRVVGQLVDKGLLDSSSPRSPLRLAFPADALEDLFPRFFFSNAQE